jgi:hypothetical protein
MDDWNSETTVLSLVPPTVPTWAVFTADEGDDTEIWKMPIHLWAHVRTALSAEENGTREFLGKDVPKPRLGIVGMVLDEGGPTVVTETDGLFLGYTDSADAESDEDWRGRVPAARRQFARKMAALRGVDSLHIENRTK